jgi:hypothetical protein
MYPDNPNPIRRRNCIDLWEVDEAIRLRHTMYHRRRRLKVLTISSLLLVWAGLMAWMLGLIYLF